MRPEALAAAPRQAHRPCSNRPLQPDGDRVAALAAAPCRRGSLCATVTTLAPARPRRVQRASALRLPRRLTVKRTVLACVSRKETFSLPFFVRSVPATATLESSGTGADDRRSDRGRRGHRRCGGRDRRLRGRRGRPRRVRGERATRRRDWRSGARRSPRVRASAGLRSTDPSSALSSAEVEARGAAGVHERGGAGDVRRRHRGAAVGHVGVRRALLAERCPRRGRPGRPWSRRSWRRQRSRRGCRSRRRRRCWAPAARTGRRREPCRCRRRRCRRRRRRACSDARRSRRGPRRSRRRRARRCDPHAELAGVVERGGDRAHRAAAVPPSARSGSILTCGATPTTPTPLSPAAAIVPATCVPWPWSSWATLSPRTKSQPWTSST